MRPGPAQRVCGLDARCYCFRCHKEGTAVKDRRRGWVLASVGLVPTRRVSARTG
jgi:hypothetical protein